MGCIASKPPKKEPNLELETWGNGGFLGLPHETETVLPTNPGHEAYLTSDPVFNDEHRTPAHVVGRSELETYRKPVTGLKHADDTKAELLYQANIGDKVAKARAQLFGLAPINNSEQSLEDRKKELANHFHTDAEDEIVMTEELEDARDQLFGKKAAVKKPAAKNPRASPGPGLALGGAEASSRAAARPELDADEANPFGSLEQEEVEERARLAQEEEARVRITEDLFGSVAPNSATPFDKSSVYSSDHKHDDDDLAEAVSPPRHAAQQDATPFEEDNSFNLEEEEAKAAQEAEEALARAMAEIESKKRSPAPAVIKPLTPASSPAPSAPVAAPVASVKLPSSDVPSSLATPVQKTPVPNAPSNIVSVKASSPRIVTFAEEEYDWGETDFGGAVSQVAPVVAPVVVPVVAPAPIVLAAPPALPTATAASPAASRVATPPTPPVVVETQKAPAAPPVAAAPHEPSPRISEHIEEEEEEEPLAVVTFDFDAQEEGELSLFAGEAVVLLNQTDSEWWLGRVLGREGTGLFPCAYCRVLSPKEASNVRASFASSHEQVYENEAELAEPTGVEKAWHLPAPPIPETQTFDEDFFGVASVPVATPAPPPPPAAQVEKASSYYAPPPLPIQKSEPKPEMIVFSQNDDAQTSYYQESFGAPPAVEEEESSEADAETRRLAEESERELAELMANDETGGMAEAELELEREERDAFAQKQAQRTAQQETASRVSLLQGDMLEVDALVATGKLLAAETLYKRCIGEAQDLGMEAVQAKASKGLASIYLKDPKKQKLAAPLFEIAASVYSSLGQREECIACLHDAATAHLQNNRKDLAIKTLERFDASNIVTFSPAFAQRIADIKRGVKTYNPNPPPATKAGWWGKKA